MSQTPTPRCDRCHLDKTMRRDGTWVCCCCEIQGHYPCGHAAESKRDTYRV